MGTCARLTDLCFSYAGPSATVGGAHSGKHGELDHINATISDGDFIAVAGLTGSGKTTLLRHLTCDHRPSGKRTGTITLFGLAPQQLHAQHDDSLISYVPQRPREMLCAATLRQELNIRLGSSARGQLAATDILGFLGLSQFIDRPIDDLSEGQAQRAGLAAALAQRPQLLLLDEPTANLDSVTRRMTLDLLQRVNRDIGVTVVMADHHLDGLLTIASRIIALDHGSIIADATPAEALHQLWDAGTREAQALVPDVQHYFLATASKRSRQALSASDDSNGSGALPLTVAAGRVVLQQQNIPSEQPASQSNVAVSAPAPTVPTVSAAPANFTGNTAYPIAVRVRDMSYAHEGETDFAIADLHLEARYGELIMLLGQSGSGKSTLLDLLVGIKRPQFGSVRWNLPSRSGALHGRPASKSAEAIAFLPQDVRPLLNLSAGARLTANPSAETLPDPLDRSIGQQQLDAFDSLKSRGKNIYLLDEPTQGLDQIATARVGTDLQALARSGCLVIAATHDVDFCARYADRALVLAAGQIVADGSPRAIIADEMFSTTPIRRLFRSIRPGILTLPDALSHALPDALPNALPTTVPGTLPDALRQR